MAIGEQAAVLEGVRRIFEGGTAAALGSDSLLRRFAATGDEAAFAGIVARHGPMVFAVCRRALRDPHDVEDAFQATFLVFVRRAGSIRDGEGVGPWLHGVARRVATRARATAARRRARERSDIDVEHAAPGVDPDREELTAVVDEEIGRLPERYRRAIVLCDLEGCTQPEAAGRLGWSEGSLRGRLTRGRAMLRSRLRRRGLVAPAGAIGGLAASESASASRLGEAFVRALTRIAAGDAAAGTEGVTAKAVALAGEILGTMMQHKLFAVAVMAFVAGVALSGAGVATISVLKARSQQAASPKVAERPPSPPPITEVPPEGEGLPRLPNPAGPSDPFFRPPSPPGLPEGITADIRKATEILNPAAPFEEGNPPSPLEGTPPGLPELPSVRDLKNPPDPEPADARRFAVGDLIDIEVLEAFPGRPITGDRIVRPDGTVSLGFYGDLKVAGLTRREVKVKVIEFLRPFLTDQALGLVQYDEREKQYFWVHPSKSNRVYVDDSSNYARINASTASPTTSGSNRPGPAREVIFPGDRVAIRLPGRHAGRPIDDVRVVGPDGSIKLEGYEDFKVGGLTPAAARAKLIEHIRQSHPTGVPYVAVTADETTVDVAFAPIPGTTTGTPPRGPTPERVDALERKLDRVLSEIEALRKERGR